MKSVKNIISLTVIISCSLLLFFTRSTPVSKIWKSFQVLYAENSVSEEKILSVLDKNGCKGVISFSQQRQPLFSIYTPVELKQPSSDYLTERLKYFCDKQNQFRLYYIPEEYNSEAEKALSQIQKELTMKAGLDGKSNYLWILPVLCVIFYLIFTIASKNKKLFFALSLFPVLFVFSKPFFADAAAVIMFMQSVFLSEKYWNRKKAAKVISTSFYTIVSVISSVAVIFIFSWIDGLIFLAVIAAVYSFYLLMSSFEKFRNKRLSFTYSYIVPADMLPSVTKESSKFILLAAAGIAVMIFLFFFQGRFSSGATYRGLILPSPVDKGIAYIETGDGSPEENAVSEISEQLPDLENYYEWVWDTVTFPYRNLNSRSRQREPLEKGEQIILDDYVDTENGIVKEQKVIYEYNDAFIEKIDKNIEKLNYPAIEKLMKEQGEEYDVVYSASSNGTSQDNDSRSFVLIILCLFVTIIMYFYYYLTGRKI